MKRRGLLLWICFVCLCSVVWAVIPVAAQQPKGKKSAAEKTAVAAADVSKPPQAPVQYTGFESKRDPFGLPEIMERLLKKPDSVPGVKIETVQLPKVSIEGLIYSRAMPQVIIDGVVKGVGDFIGDFEIKEILEHGIVLFYKGREYTLRLTENRPSTTGGGRQRPTQRR